jgi:hypothetical protein
VSHVCRVSGGARHATLSDSRSAHQGSGRQELATGRSAFNKPPRNRSPTGRGALALSCDLLQRLFQSEIKRSVLLCFILEERFQGLACSSINRTLHSRDLLPSELTDAVAFNLQGTMSSTRRIGSRYVTSAQKFSRTYGG